MPLDPEEIVAKFPKLAPAFETAKNVFLQPLDKVTINLIGQLDMYSSSGTFPWALLATYLLQYPDLQLSTKPVVRYEDADGYVYWGQIDPDTGKPDANAFYRKQNSFSITEAFKLGGEENQFIKYTFHIYSFISEEYAGKKSNAKIIYKTGDVYYGGVSGNKDTIKKHGFGLMKAGNSHKYGFYRDDIFEKEQTIQSNLFLSTKDRQF